MCSFGIEVGDKRGEEDTGRDARKVSFWQDDADTWRHIHTSQAFIPMSKGVIGGAEALMGGGAYLVVVALNGKDDKPDVSTMRAFLGTVAQGMSFDEGIWRESSDF